jgi:FkbM family methyltransferase
MLRSRLSYYLTSIPRILRGFRNWPTVLALFFGLPIPRPATLVVRDSALALKVRTALDAWLVKEVCIDRQYEAASVPIQDGWTVIDIGGGIGEFAIDVAKRYPHSRVWAYEPAPDSFSLLQENIALNNLTNLQASPYAVAGASGQVGLRRSSGQGSLTSTIEEGGAAAATAVTLAEILHRNGIPICDYLKIDCEGCEYSVLLSASSETLRRIGVICLEYHDRLMNRSHLELVDHLEQNGFRVTTHPSPVHRGQGLLSAIRAG